MLVIIRADGSLSEDDFVVIQNVDDATGAVTDQQAIKALKFELEVSQGLCLVTVAEK